MGAGKGTRRGGGGGSRGGGGRLESCAEVEQRRRAPVFWIGRGVGGEAVWCAGVGGGERASWWDAVWPPRASVGGAWGAGNGGRWRGSSG